MHLAVRTVHLVIAGGLLASCSASADWRGPAESAASVNVALPSDSRVVEDHVPARATLDTILRAQHLTGETASAMGAAIQRVFNPRDLRAGRAFRVARALDGAFREFQYDIDADRFLRVRPRGGPAGADGAPGAAGTAGQFDAEIVSYPREVSLESVTADITRQQSSLLAALDAGHQGIQLGLLLADIFSGEVDFNADLRPGDRIEAVFERVSHHGTATGYGDVKAAVLELGARRLTAVGFTDADGKTAWYDEQGRSLKRQFLKSPLPFEPRITSGYSSDRVHPIYGDHRAHYGVDYGADAGTKVVAVAAGVVESADWAGDAGRMVSIRHSSGYETLYLHLSAFAPGLHAGTRVSQGDFIGRVGSSGAATGPHLDYRIKKNGAYVNPIAELARMPKGEPIDPARMTAFLAERDQVLLQLPSFAAPPARHLP